ncbi:hypothetical protein E2320_003335 [Naja naja]|nr:hypothetical protein E2320_003335 [Naja naja]
MVNMLEKLLLVPISFVPHQGAVEMQSKDDEHDTNWNHNHRGGHGSIPARAARRDCGVPIMEPFRSAALPARPHVADRHKLDPANQHHFSEEEEDAQGCGEAPGQLNIVVHSFMGRLVDRIEVVDVTDGFDIGQDAGADHKSEEMDGHQHCRAGTEGHQQLPRVVIVFQLHFHHGYLEKNRLL